MNLQIGQPLNRAMDDALNAEGRSGTHVASGLAILTAVGLAAAVVAYGAAPTRAKPLERVREATLRKPAFQPSQHTVAAASSAKFVLLGLSGLRVWNAPPSPDRTRALGLWGLIQAIQGLSVLAGAKEQSLRLAADLGSAIASLAYAQEAKKVDTGAATIIAPYASWAAFASLVTAEVWRRNKDRLDVR